MIEIAAVMFTIAGLAAHWGGYRDIKADVVTGILAVLGCAGGFVILL